MSRDTAHHRAAGGLVALVLAVGVTALAVAHVDPIESPGIARAVDTSPARAALGTTTRYAPITPIRVLDTRTDIFRHRLPANGAMSIAPVTAAVSNASGVPIAQVQAAVLNITMVDSGAAGFTTVWPTGSPQPIVSSLNADLAAQNVANLVTVPIGADGFVSLFSSSGADYVIDVQGVYASASSSTSGRLVPIAPSRAIDTRRGGTLPPGGSLVVDLTTVGVPADASAAVLNVTATNTWAAGFFTVWPGGTMPVASNLNVPGAGHTVANQVIARVTNGRVSVFSEAGGDIIVDVSGYITGSTAPDSTSGLYVPLAPARLLDTRSPGPYSSGQPLGSGMSLTLPIVGRAGIPVSGVQAVALNVTATRTLAYGYVTTWPAGGALPATSTLNFVAAGRTVPNHVITGLGGGAASFYSFGGNDLLVDLMGYWTDALSTVPVTSTAPMPTTPSLTINTINPPVTTPQPGAPPSTGPHAFLYDYGSGLHGRWNPCAPIVYLVNADRADQAMVDQLNLAIAEVEQATGLDFLYGGPTSAGLDLNVPAGADAVLGFSDQNATSYLAGGVIGIGGGTFDPVSGRVDTGFAFADVDDIASPEKLRATFMHEIAHMVGLDHVPSNSQLMYSFATSISTFQNGDREGLWRVGSAQGCIAGDESPGGPPPSTVLVVRT